MTSEASQGPGLPELLAAARGEQPCDLVLHNCAVVDVFQGELRPGPLAVHGGRVVGLGDYRGRREEDLAGAIVAPGFIEGHLHVESSLLSPAELARAVCPRGTTLIVADPHEIANVMGSAGVEAMLAASADLPVSFRFMAPACVPATNLETAGAELGPSELDRLAQHRRVIGLAEVMNFPAAAAGDPQTLAKLAAFQGRPIDGHAPLLSGKQLNAYVLAGPQSDHECSNQHEGAEKLGAGMWLMIRSGTSAQDLPALLPLVTPASERRCLLVSDDRHPDDLAQKGHLDSLLRQAVADGLDPLVALRLVTLNPARRFGLERRGALAPGYAADLAVLSDLNSFRVSRVYRAGRLVAREGECLHPCSARFPASASQTMHLPPLDQARFQVPVERGRVRVIEMTPGSLISQAALEETPAQDGLLAADPARDLARLTVIERHWASGRAGQGLLRGLGLKKGALASSVAHDSHNLVVAGSDTASMLAAAQEVARQGGGLAAAQGGRVLASLALPLAGLMSDAPLGRVLEELGRLRRAAAQVCSTPEPFMMLSFVALPVIPHLKLSDRGLIDVDAMAPVALFAP